MYRRGVIFFFSSLREEGLFSILCHAGIHKTLHICRFYATLAYIRHFIFAGCYDNDPWYLVTNLGGHLGLTGHLDLAGFYFSKCAANSKLPAFSSDDRESPSLNIMDLPGLEHTSPLTGSWRSTNEPWRLFSGFLISMKNPLTYQIKIFSRIKYQDPALLKRAVH
jgi:hypothetical protein